MQKLVWQNANGVELDLTSGNYGITEWEGFSNTSLNIQQQQVPFQDGGVFLDALIEQRELSVTLAMQDNNNLELRYQQRRELISALNPKLGEGYLIYTNDFISKRIKCVPQIPLFETHNSDTVGTPKASLSWTACSPYWEDLEETVVEIGAGEIQNITNNGDIKVGVQINIPPYTPNPNIKNKTTMQTINYKGIEQTELQINTAVGNKTVLSKDFTFDWLYGATISGIATDGNVTLFYGSKIIILKDTDNNYKKINTDSFPIVVNISRIKYINNKFIAIGNAGFVATSDNGEDWETKRYIYPSGEHLTDIDFGDGKYVVCGENGNILTSQDLLNWNIIAGQLTTDKFRTVVYGGGIWVIGGEDTSSSSTSSVFSVSTNTTTWNRTVVQGASIRYMCYGNGKFVGTAYNGYIWKSGDGQNWQYTNIGTTNNLKEIIYTNKFVVITQNGQVAYSEDVENWELKTIRNDDLLQTIIFAENKYFVAGLKTLVMASIDLETWETYKEFLYGTIRSLLVNDGFVLASADTNIIKSTDLINWELITTTSSQMKLKYVNGKYIAFGTSIMWSEDLINWQSTSWVSTMYDIDYGNGLYVGVGYGGTIATSEDLSSWTVRTSGVSNTLNGVAFGNGKFVAVGQTRNILYSTDGINWNYTQMAAQTIYNGIVYYKNLFITTSLVSVCVSIDGITWEAKPAITTNTNELKTVKVVEGQIVVIAETSCFFGADGNKWVEKFVGSGINNLFAIVKYKENYFLGGEKDYRSKDFYINKIQNINAVSDMGLNLIQGQNELQYLNQGADNYITIKYRQKYIGV